MITNPVQTILSNAIAIVILSLLCWPASGSAQSLQDDVQTILEEAGEGTRWGVSVTDVDGEEIVAINPQNRFMPASNTKIFVTAAAYWMTANQGVKAAPGDGTTVHLEPAGVVTPANVILRGVGDTRLSTSPDCMIYCLATMADAIAAQTNIVSDIIGDDTAFPDERWSAGMSWNNIPFSYGTAISALSIDDNQIAMLVSPAIAGAKPSIELPSYYIADNRAVTVAGSEDTLWYSRIPGSRTIILTGTIGTETTPVALRLGVDDPAHYTAWQLAAMLKERGVEISGNIRARHRPLDTHYEIAARSSAVAENLAAVKLANFAPQPLTAGVERVNKQSQNLHAELLLRKIGLFEGSGSVADGQTAIITMLAEAGIESGSVSLADGSGMSSYNRVSPRAMTRLLAWIDAQRWGDEWETTLPVGGVDGTLRSRFAGTSLEGNISAKTGSLNATSALAGYMITNSGRRLAFAIYANDVPAGIGATAIMDKALIYIASSN